MKHELDLATIIAITLAGDAEIIGYGFNDIATVGITFHADKEFGNYVHVTDLVKKEYRCFFGDKPEDLLRSVWKFLEKTNFCGFKFIHLWNVSIGIHRYDKFVGYVYDRDAAYIYVDPNEEGGYSVLIDNALTHDSFIGTDMSPFMALIKALRSSIEYGNEHGNFNYSNITSWVMDKEYARVCERAEEEEEEEALYAQEPDYDYIPEDDDDEEEISLPF